MTGVSSYSSKQTQGAVLCSIISAGSDAGLGSLLVGLLRALFFSLLSPAPAPPTMHFFDSLPTNYWLSYTGRDSRGINGPHPTRHEIPPVLCLSLGSVGKNKNRIKLSAE